MRQVIDLHTHSKYSRACSPQLNIPNLAKFGKIKGIDILGTGDFLHPVWIEELKKDLEEDGSGLLRLKADSQQLKAIKFVLSVELASIYKDKGKLRKVHNVITLSSFAAVEKLRKTLSDKKINLAYDGRPIVGISCKNLLEICLEADEKAMLIPAHIWTPWFGVFGSKSGYDNLEECFEDLTPYVYAIETGISSDPGMNWRVPSLDRVSIVSFSDAHSLPNLGREATVVELSKPSYENLLCAVSGKGIDRSLELDSPNASLAPEENLRQARTHDPLKIINNKIVETIEFYPEEGKYHFTGHRKCKIKYTPEDTKNKGTVCPVCGRDLTVGVMERVEVLGKRSNAKLQMTNDKGIIKSQTFPDRPGYRLLVSLMQIIGQSQNIASKGKKAEEIYTKLINKFGGEIDILTSVSLKDIEYFAGKKLAEGILQMRNGNLTIDPGFDGEYGKVKISFDSLDKTPQLDLFK